MDSSTYFLLGTYHLSKCSGGEEKRVLATLLFALTTETSKRDDDEREAKNRRNEKNKEEADKRQSAIDELENQVGDLMNRTEDGDHTSGAYHPPDRHKSKERGFLVRYRRGLARFCCLSVQYVGLRAKLKDDDEKWREERRWEKTTREEDRKEKKEEREEDKREKQKEREEAREEAKKREKRELLERLHQTKLSAKEEEIKRLKGLNKSMQNCLDLEPLPGWLPGSPGKLRQAQNANSWRTDKPTRLCLPLFNPQAPEHTDHDSCLCVDVIRIRSLVHILASNAHSRRTASTLCQVSIVVSRSRKSARRLSFVPYFYHKSSLQLNIGFRPNKMKPWIKYTSASAFSRSVVPALPKL
ncbi:hypothetical protein BDR22DRAFT_967188 [Usnea florida]